ncbi:uncharacterized protein PG986_010127 [Apiospora aurea]|uniref:Uncharacterized protein n=1 Tax=Apiospora aurea TaxID=335848 RepID=A0ABR1QAW6_9PEZI
MTTANSSKLHLLVRLDESLVDQLDTNGFHLLSLEKDELSTMTVEGLSGKVLDLLRAIEQKKLVSRFEDPRRQAHCQMRCLEVNPVLYNASRPKRLRMQWPDGTALGRRVCLGYMVDDAAFQTWWEYWQRFKDTELCLHVETDRGASWQ